MREIDRIDKEILSSIAKCEGKPIIEYVRGMSTGRKLRTLYERVAILADDGLLRIDRGTEQKFCLVYLTSAGTAAIQERAEDQPQTEAMSS